MGNPIGRILLIPVFCQLHAHKQHTSRLQVMVGTGFPEAMHSIVTSVPFFTTMFPSSGLGLTLEGTVRNYNVNMQHLVVAFFEKKRLPILFAPFFWLVYLCTK